MIHSRPCLATLVLVLSVPILALTAIAEPLAEGSDWGPQLVVKFKPGTSPDDRTTRGALTGDAARLAALGEKYTVQRRVSLVKDQAMRSERNPLTNVYTLPVSGNVDLEAMARDYEKLESVEYAHPDYLMEMFDLPNDPLIAHQWAISNSGQEHYHVERLEGDNNDTLALVQGLAGADIHTGPVFDAPPDNTAVVVVAVIDTGCDRDHPDLVGQFWSNEGEIADNEIDDDHNGYVDDTHGWDFSGNDIDFYPIYEDNDPSDLIGHGTHCAGIVAASSDNGEGMAGVVPGARIMALKVFPAAIHSVISSAIVYAAENGADVISMSFGGPYASPVMTDAMDYARGCGVVLLAASGNTGHIENFYPASSEGVIAVSATNDLDQVTTFSTVNDNISVCAPGQSILSLRAAGTDLYGDHDEPLVHIIDENYYIASGTSMACPYAAAVAAYVRSVAPGLSADGVRTVLEVSADDYVDPYGLGWDNPGWDMYSGHGRVNLQAALAAAPGVRAILTSPARYAILTGSVEVFGSANGLDYTGHVLEYAADGETAWTEIASSATPVDDGLLGVLNLDGLNGPVQLRLRVGTECVAMREFFAAGDSRAEITSPADSGHSTGLLCIDGFAYCPDFAFMVLEHGEGEYPSAWELVDTLTVPVSGGRIMTWTTTLLSDGLHALRLSVYSNVGLMATDTVVFTVFSPFNGEDGWIVELDTNLSQSVNYGDFDDDGVNELVVGSWDGVYFLDLDGNLKTAGMPIMPAFDARRTPAVGNLDGDGIDDLVVVGTFDSTVYGFPSSAPAFQKKIPTRCSRVYLKDIDGDGIDEVHVERALSTRPAPAHYFPLRSDGTGWGYGFPLPHDYVHCFPADLDGDHVCEFYAYNQYSHFLVEFDTLGVPVDSVLLEVDGFGLFASDITSSAVDLDSDGDREVIFQGWSTSDPWNPSAHSNEWAFAFDFGLATVGGWPRDLHGTGNSGISQVSFGDMDGDGELEYAVTAGDNVRAWHLDGSPLLESGGEEGILAIPPNIGGMSGLVMVDVTDDQRLDVLLPVHRDTWRIHDAERLIAFDGAGELAPGYPMLLVYPTENLWLEYGSPTAGDLDQDGFLDFTYSFGKKIAHLRLPGVDFYAEQAPCPMDFYNRRQNATMALSAEFIVECGDINGSGDEMNIADLVFLVDYMFNQGFPLPDRWAADVDGSGALDIADLVYLVNFMFNGGPIPNCP